MITDLSAEELYMLRLPFGLSPAIDADDEEAIECRACYFVGSFGWRPFEANSVRQLATILCVKLEILEVLFDEEGI